MTDSALSGEFVTKTIGPLDASVRVPGRRKITFCFGKAAMWSIPLDERQTWFVSFLVRARQDGRTDKDNPARLLSRTSANSGLAGSNPFIISAESRPKTGRAYGTGLATSTPGSK